jgi:hypothetical protein
MKIDILLLYNASTVELTYSLAMLFRRVYSLILDG